MTPRRYKGLNALTAEYQGGRSTIVNRPEGTRATVQVWKEESVRSLCVAGIMIIGLGTFVVFRLARV